MVELLLAAFSALTFVIQFYNDEAPLVALFAAWALIALLAYEIWTFTDTRADVRIVFQPVFPTSWEEQKWFRIGVQNKSQTVSAENVNVKLVDIQPYDPDKFRMFRSWPQRLGRMNATPETRITETITINPEDTLYFDVISRSPEAINKVNLWTPSPDGNTGQEVFLDPTQEYTVTISVSANNHTRKRWQLFTVKHDWINGEDVEFYPASEAKS